MIDKRYGSKGIRLDVYVEDETSTVYNVEIQTTDKKNLPQRTRYYQDMLDLNILEKGEDYKKREKTTKHSNAAFSFLSVLTFPSGRDAMCTRLKIAAGRICILR